MYNLLQLVKNRALCAKNHKKSKRGFTLAEAAIALAVISVVTVAALTLFNSSESITRRENAEAAARYFASDLVECFRTTDNLADFRDAVDFARGYLCTDACEECEHPAPRWAKETKQLGERYEYTLTSDRNMVLTVLFVTDAETQVQTISIMASYNGRDVWDTPYTFGKGVGADA